MLLLVVDATDVVGPEERGPARSLENQGVDDDRPPLVVNPERRWRIGDECLCDVPRGTHHGVRGPIRGGLRLA